MTTVTNGSSVQPAALDTPAGIARAAMMYLAERRLAPTPQNYAQAWAASGGPAGGAGDDESAARGLRHARRLTAELTEMVKTLCGTVSALAGDESWVKTQSDALHKMLEGEIDHVSISELRAVLTHTSKMQRRIATQRRKALDQLKATLVELANVVAGLLDSTDHFTERISEHASEIEGASSISSLSDTVRHLLSDAREMRTTVSESREGLNRSQNATAALGHEVSRLEAQLAAASAEIVTDFLTQTMNRRGLEDAFAGALARARQSAQPLALALIDVDDFKKLNDALGHHAGDGALRHLATLLKDKLRPSDAVARYGGEEFVILLCGANLTAAQETMMRVQRDLTSHVYMYDEARRFITFSAGVTAVRFDDTLARAVARADDAMYRAKRDGKNCVRTA